jgi:hypothetical protein
MPTLTKLYESRIVCKTIVEERLFGLMLAGTGALSLAIGLFAMVRGANDLSKFVFFVCYLTVARVIMLEAEIPSPRTRHCCALIGHAGPFDRGFPIVSLTRAQFRSA